MMASLPRRLPLMMAGALSLEQASAGALRLSIKVRSKARLQMC